MPCTRKNPIQTSIVGNVKASKKQPFNFSHLSLSPTKSHMFNTPRGTLITRKRIHFIFPHSERYETAVFLLLECHSSQVQVSVDVRESLAQNTFECADTGSHSRATQFSRHKIPVYWSYERDRTVHGIRPVQGLLRGHVQE